MLEELFRSQRETVYDQVLRIVRDPTEAADLTQEVFVKAHRRADTLRDPDAALGWLLRIAERVCLDWLRQRKGGAAREVEADGSELADDRAPSGLETIQRQEMSSCTQHYLERLSPSYREVLALHDVEGRTASEVAALLGITLGAVKIRLHRARQRLRRELQCACTFSRDERGVFVCEPKPANRPNSILSESPLVLGESGETDHGASPQPQRERRAPC
ncbi:MAG: RNA polymerase sigma factor [Deltaproteobacteria bacterium]|nr:RNA polymerase sigma factor [Deltaproteobacteria bacterium]